MNRYLFYLISMLLLSTQPVGHTAFASPVYAGCAAGVGSPTGNAWYIDPIKGSLQGNGSPAHPWQTLSGVVAAGLFATMPTHWDSVAKKMVQNNPKAPIQPGDTVYLMSGNHGAVTIQGYYGNGVSGYNNSSFITVQAAAGQTPVLQNLTLLGGSKWIFRGLTIQSANTSGSYITAANNVPDVFLVTLAGPHQNIIIDANTITSASTTTGWTITNWITQRASGIHELAGTCVAVTNNLIRNVGSGIGTQQSSDVLIAYNVIDSFTDDGIDYGSSNTLIEYNQIYNSIEDGDGFHRDAMQGQPATEQTVNSNVSILNNTVIRLFDGGVPYPGYLQGIDAFDGIWDNLTVENNTVITDAYDGIAYFGVNSATIENNILLEDSGQLLPCYNLELAACLTQTVTYNTSTLPLVMVESAKSGAPSTNVSVTQNIATGYEMDANDPGVSMTNNLCVLTGSYCTMGYLVKGKMGWETTPGAYAGNNVISKYTPNQLFKEYNTALELYNLTLIEPNPASGASEVQ